MKSTAEQLRKRGVADQFDIDELMNLSYDELIDGINTKLPAKRTAAIRVLYMKFGCSNVKLIQTLLERLCIEKSLYTKLEICSVLEKGNATAAKLMVEYLGKIGSNQYKKLPDRVSKKVSYPLPRDIIARSLARMDKSIFEVLMEALSSQEKYKIYEVLDAIGFLIFYNRELASLKVFKSILEILKAYSDDYIIVWKSVMCFSAFSYKESIDTLEWIKRTHVNKIIKAEAERSIKLIINRNGKEELQ
ncbi:hypothetical protein [Clostridium hydrogenum]|uniref:hypothetical protein n=1 Tax=Clostridium hydrogenum TaxID=2855764 RepID=UPI001F42A5C4|nr:hypothetical protein [Clostridium hydrogenum]